MLNAMAKVPDERRNVIGRNVARLREKAGLTQAELAEKSRVSLATIAHLEVGDRENPRINTLGLLALALGVPTERLQVESEEESSGPTMTLEQFLEVERDLSDVDREALASARAWATKRGGMSLDAWIELRDWLRALRKASSVPGRSGGGVVGGTPPKK
jgi:transcriptional regulator with XRE-family HTH domain